MNITGLGSTPGLSPDESGFAYDGRGFVVFIGPAHGIVRHRGGLAALLFGIHPLHVESVAWVTERKDVLYAFFYMLALISWWSYITAGRRMSYVYSILFGALSVLAKPMALSLPLVLCLFDWLRQRPLKTNGH